MLRTIIKKVVKTLEGKFNKLSIKEELSKHSKYIEKAKEIWNMIDEDFKITDTLENKFKSKINKFDEILRTKFPELTQNDVIEIRESVVGKDNANKDSVQEQADDINELKTANAKLEEENEKLKDQLIK
jgi:hypothetical protein